METLSAPTLVLHLTQKVSNSSSENVVVKTVMAGSEPNGLAFDLANGEMYIANYGSNTVTVINCVSNEVIKTVHVGTDPIGIIVG